jgi:TPR repeat protein
MRWYLAAAAKGDAKAMLMLGGLYFEGKGVAKDPSEALNWHRKSAAKGNGRAMWYVGMAYLIGKAVPKNDAEGVRWFRLSAAKGDDNGQNSLAEMLRTGSGVVRDPAAALRDYRLAADQGNATALFNMARLIETGGPGVTKDEAEAFRLRQAAQSADPKKWRTFVVPLAPATMVPGRASEAASPAYDTVDQDYVADYRQQALNGSEGAMWALATHHEVGMGGFRKDINEAARWYRMLSDRGSEKARQWLIDHGYSY